MRRTTRRDLERLVTRLAHLQGRPAECWTHVDGRPVANVGALHLDHAPEYGGWDLVELVNAGGGESSLIGNTFAGRGRLKAHEMESFLLGMLIALEGTPYWPARPAPVAQ